MSLSAACVTDGRARNLNDLLNIAQTVRPRAYDSKESMVRAPMQNSELSEYRENQKISPD